MQITTLDVSHPIEQDVIEDGLAPERIRGGLGGTETLHPLQNRYRTERQDNDKTRDEAGGPRVAGWRDTIHDFS
jgi:hypothetical protein